MQTLNTPPPAAPAQDDRLARLLAWLGELIQEHGTGDYIVTVHADGSVLVKRPRKPMEFKYGG